MPTKAGQVVFEDIVQGRTFWEVNGSARGTDGYIIPYLSKSFILSRPMTYKRYLMKEGRIEQLERGQRRGYLLNSYWVYVYSFHEFGGSSASYKNAVSLSDRGIAGPNGKRTNYNRNRWFVTEGAARSYMGRLRLIRIPPKIDDNDLWLLDRAATHKVDIINMSICIRAEQKPDHHVININTIV